MRAGVVIRGAEVPGDIGTVRRLFEAYAAALDVDLCFQGFAQELAELPGDYAPPRGVLLVAEQHRAPIGCVALRPLPDAGRGTTGEVKRLYVAPDGRGAGVGRALMDALIARARALGYDEIKLDTLASMTSARSLYASLGFSECGPYYRNPLPGVAYLSLGLRAPS